MLRLGAIFTFENDVCNIRRNSKLLAVGELQGKLYILKIVEHYMNVAKEQSFDSDLNLWHCRLGHLGIYNVMKLVENDMVDGIGNVTGENQFCEACMMTKKHRCSFPKGVSLRAKEPFKIIHSDVCGPIQRIPLVDHDILSPLSMTTPDMYKYTF